MMEGNVSARTRLAGEMHVAISNAMGGSWRNAAAALPVTGRHGLS